MLVWVLTIIAWLLIIIVLFFTLAILYCFEPCRTLMESALSINVSLLFVLILK